jgi:peptidoglycan hydrolase-like protein with peptidoglycan-binding domain
MSVLIAPRASWGPKGPNGDKDLAGLASEVYLHHTATGKVAATASVNEEIKAMLAIESIGIRRFSQYGQGISYNVLIFPSGRAYQGVDFNRRGAHTDSRNTTARSLCFVGNYEIDEPTEAQLRTAAAILREGRGKWWVSGAPLRGHRDIKATACPGRNVYAQRSTIVALSHATSAGPVSNPVAVAPAKPAAPAPAPTRNSYRTAGQEVRKGDTGPAVYEVQRILANLGFYAGKADGQAGVLTDQAIRAFQFAAGLVVDGSFGPKSRAAAARVPAYPGASAPSRHRNAATGKYQQRLRDRGWRIAVDLFHGPATSSTLRAFQLEKRLTPDGLGGPQTWTALWTRP